MSSLYLIFYFCDNVTRVQGKRFKAKDILFENIKVNQVIVLH